MIAQLLPKLFSKSGPLVILALLAVHYTAVFYIGLYAYYALAVVLLPLLVYMRKPLRFGTQGWLADQAWIVLLLIIPFFVMAYYQRLVFGQTLSDMGGVQVCMLDTAPVPTITNFISPFILLYLVAFYASRRTFNEASTALLAVTLLAWWGSVHYGLNALAGYEHRYDDTLFGGLVAYWPAVTPEWVSEVKCGNSGHLAFKFI